MDLLKARPRPGFGRGLEKSRAVKGQWVKMEKWTRNDADDAGQGARIISIMGCLFVLFQASTVVGSRALGQAFWGFL